MSTISTSDVKKLARLSALTLNDNELVSMQADLGQILDYVQQLEGVDTDGVAPTYQVHNLHTVTRSDEIVDYGVTQTDLLKNAPAHTAGSVVVPRVLE